MLSSAVILESLFISITKILYTVQSVFEQGYNFCFFGFVLQYIGFEMKQ